MLEIKKNVPIPSACFDGLKENYLKMEIGDCIEVQVEWQKVIHLYAKRAGIKVKSRQTSDKIITVWRIRPRSSQRVK